MVVSDYSSILPGILLVKIPLGTKSEKRKTGNKNKKIARFLVHRSCAWLGTALAPTAGESCAGKNSPIDQWVVAVISSPPFNCKAHEDSTVYSLHSMVSHD